MIPNPLPLSGGTTGKFPLHFDHKIEFLSGKTIVQGRECRSEIRMDMITLVAAQAIVKIALDKFPDRT